MFNELAASPDIYQSFYSAFSTNIKLGIHEDSANRSKLDLLRFPSNKTREADASSQPDEKSVVEEKNADPMAALAGKRGHQGSMVSLKDYVARMPTDQEEIYVITGASCKAVEGSPFLERFLELGSEVLYLTDPIDEYVLGSMASSPYEGKRLVDITKEGTNPQSAEKDDAENKAVCELIKKVIGDKIARVETSKKFVQSPCALAVPQHAQSANMERIMRAQPLQSEEQRFMLDPMMNQRTLLINPGHELIAWLRKRTDAYGEAEKAADDTQVKETVQLLYDTALMSSGFALEEPGRVASLIQKLLLSKL